MTLDERLIQVVPTARQIAHQSTEFYAFVHFGMNTFTDREWGDGRESPEIFDPYAFDADQWVAAIKSAGMRGLILTCKHHDGFCLWDSKLTEHCVSSSPYKKDVVRQVADACKRGGIKFGVYLSPWDMNSPLYGQGKPYDDYFVGQLRELLTGYGEVFSVWFDGACGEGPNGKKQYYDWERYYKTIRELQPNACVSVCGEDVRWCGNEAGYTRPAEWSVVPKRTKDTEKVASLSQQSDSVEFRKRKIAAWDQDLGSRDILKDEPELIWYPAEVNTSIRPGWFWHESENGRVRGLGELINIYYNSVGGNATFLLNIPPMKNGLFHENDVKRLGEIGDFLRKAFGTNLLPSAELFADSEAEGHEINGILADDYDTYYTPERGRNTACIIAEWQEEVNIGHIVIKENITKSQRIESFAVDVLTDGEFKEIYAGSVVGYKKIIPLKGVKTSAVRIRITDSRCEPTVAFLGIYEAIV